MILDRILEHKKAELRRKDSRSYLSELKGRISGRAKPLGFISALEDATRKDAPALIAEIKKASPSKGLMRPDFAKHFDPVAIGETYKEHGAAAVSVLTDQDYFHGSLDNLAQVKKHVDLPALNKEFMVDDIQFYEARAYGADAVLLIVAALDRIQLEDFHAVALGLELDILIETHHEREVDMVLERIPQAQLIGINNRDLKTFSTDLSITARLATRIPADRLIVSESGIHTRAHVDQILEAGARAMLVGESLIKSDDIGKQIDDLLGSTSKATDEEQASQGTRWV